MGGRSMKDVGGAVLAGSTPPFLGRERAAVDVDVGPERRSPRYHETYRALESVEESSELSTSSFFFVLSLKKKHFRLAPSLLAVKLGRWRSGVFSERLELW